MSRGLESCGAAKNYVVRGKLIWCGEFLMIFQKLFKYLKFFPKTILSDRMLYVLKELWQKIIYSPP